MITLQKLIDCIENIAPLSIQEPWDNSGLQLGDPSANVSSALISLDVTPSTIETAISVGANVIISHHPILITPIRNITPQTLTGQIILLAASHNIAIYSSHTPMDSSPQGLNQWIADKLHLQNVSSLTPLGLGRIGSLPQKLTAEQFAQLLKTTFNIPYLRTNATPSDSISRVAVCSGSGSSLIPQVLETDADTYICADLKYHHYQQPNLKLFDIGHYESENQFISIIYSVISENFPTFALHKSNSNFTSII